ncbi:MAG TPA: cell division protein ZapA [Firmicutes bacterium]|nr:cell division protein ZapA [Bacillota bacterium]
MEDKEKIRVTVAIMGEEYVLRGSTTPEQLYRVGSYVDHMMKMLAERNIQVSKHKIAVLAALNIADELLRLKDEQTGHPGTEKKRGEADELV